MCYTWFYTYIFYSIIRSTPTLIILSDIFVCVIILESKKVTLIHCLFILNYFVLVTETQDYVIVIVYVHIVQGIGCT